MSTNGQPPAPQTPRMPWGVYLDGAAVDFEKVAGGYVEAVFTPIAVDAGGRVGLMPPQVRVRFSPEGWATFCRLVADSAPIQVAQRIPPQAA